MRLFVKSGWRTAVTLAALGLLFDAVWAQTPGHKRPSFRFDIRRYGALVQRMTQGAVPEKSALAEQRKAAVLAATPPVGAGMTLLGFNDFGLPKAVVYAAGARPAAGGGDPLTQARRYLREHVALFPLSEGDLEGLRTAATSRSGNLTFVTLNQTLHGIPVFGGHLRLVLDGNGGVVHAGADEVVANLSMDTRPRLQPAEAARAALAWLRAGGSGELTALPSPREGRSVFAHPEGAGRNPVVTELSIFPMSADSARLAYRVFAEGRGSLYEILLDAADGGLLYAADLRREAGQARVWRESPAKGDRELVSLPDTWLPAAGTATNGNNTDTYLDEDADDAPDTGDLENISDGRAFSSSGVFDFPAGEGSTGQDPLEFPAAAVTNAFYFINLAHDFFYGLGFTETAGNFQVDNLGRGGEGGDAVKTEVHDPIVFGNAFFLATPEGMAPRLELGIEPLDFFNDLDDRDYALDGEVVVHEYSHGVQERSVGGPDDVSCLIGMQSAAMGEGTADYFGTSYFKDPVAGDYSANNAEHGLRRYRYDQNPLTYEDLGNDGFETHNDGEIWGAALWDIRKALGAEATDQLVMDALKTLPCGPSMIDARDAILHASEAGGGTSNRSTLWQIFAARGMGNSASGVDPGFLESNVFNAAFDLPPTGIGENRYPSILSRPEELGTVGEPYSYRVRASDADEDPLRFELVEGPPGMTVNPTTGEVTFTPTSLAGPRAKVAVTDGKGGRVVHGFSIPVLTILTLARPVTIEGPAGSPGFAAFLVQPNTPVVQVTLRGGSGDPDLTLLGPDSNFRDSFRSGTTETITVADPEPGVWLVVVDAFEAFSGVSLAVSVPKAKEFAANSRLNDLRQERTSETFYQFAVPAGSTSVTVSTGGGSGDVDLFLARERYPVCQGSIFVDTECDFDESSANDGNFESITTDGAAAAVAARLSGPGRVTLEAEPGQWFINLAGFSAYDGVTLTVTVDGVSAAPKIAAGGVVNAASFEALVAPGGIATLFGSGLATATAQAGSLPLPRTLGGARVLLNGVEAPLFYASAGQINFQVPFETPAGQAALVVEREGVPSAVAAAPVQTNAPGIFTYQPEAGKTAAVIIHADGSLVTPAQPARAGEALVIFATGVGGLVNPPATGEAAASDPLAVSAVTPQVTVGGAAVEVLFAGLTPGFVGLMQVNVQLPDTLPAGGSLELVVDFDGNASQAVMMAVE